MGRFPPLRAIIQTSIFPHPSAVCPDPFPWVPREDGVREPLNRASTAREQRLLRTR